MKRPIAFAILPALLLAACGDDPAPAGDGDETAAAEGEVLGGSISDDMLPLGQLESQSPPLREAAGSSDSSSAPTARAPTESEPEEAAPPAETGETASQAAPDESAAAEGED